MASLLQRRWMRIVLPLVALAGGLLVGWLVLGWWLWPVQWTDALALDLAPADRERYLDVVAESYTLNRDAGLASERLASFAAGEQDALLADVRTRVAQRVTKTENILILGQDQRPGWEAWRTDSIMVVAIDRENGQVGVISIPRDLYVDIPTYGKERINIADYIGEKIGYPGGGPALAGRVISETFGIPTHHYVRIHLNGLVELVDALGGVMVTLDCPLYEATPKDATMTEYVPWSLPAGDVWLDGDTARKFVTYRHVTTDFGRSQRQQQLIWALRNRALEIDLISRLPQLWAAMSDLYTTDLSLIDVVKLAQFAAGLQPTEVHGLQFSMDALDEIITDGGQWVLVVGDRSVLETEKEKLFMRKALERLGRNETGEACPPPPTE